MCEHRAQPFPAPRGDYRHARCSASEPTWQSHSGQECRGADGKASRRGGSEGPRGGDRVSGTTLTPRTVGRRRHARLAGRIPARPASTPIPAINGSAASGSCGYRPFGGAESGTTCHPPFSPVSANVRRRTTIARRSRCGTAAQKPGVVSIFGRTATPGHCAIRPLPRFSRCDRSILLAASSAISESDNDLNRTCLPPDFSSDRFRHFENTP